jgi:tetratricopeptide (TPR) repeat protein
MSQKRTARPRFDAETIRACGELLRCVDEPRALRANALARRVAPPLDRHDVARILRDAFDELTVRQREIVVRCDIKRERYAAVAAALYVSERHLFRERRTALSRIADRLLTGARAYKRPAVAVAPDAFDVRFALAEALDNSGNWQAASEILERLAADVASSDQRGVVEARLARLYRDADRFAPAFHHAGLARRLADRATIDGELQRAEADLALAGVAASAGDWKLCDDIAERTIMLLRPRTDRSLGTRVPSALAEALLLKAELLVDNGGVEQARGLASEACSIVGGNAVGPSVEISCRAMAALTSLLLTRDVQRSEEALWECYRDAVAAGLIRGSLIIAMHLATHYRTNDRPADALRLLTPLVGTARVAGSGWVQGGVLGQLVHANLQAGSLTAAAAYAEQLSQCAVGNPLSRALVEMSRARIHLARREYAPALGAAGASEAVYTSVGMGRYIGLTLQLQAEALAGLGESERAHRTISQAIEVLKETSHPRPLASAYRVMARITGRRKYELAARQLLDEVWSAH